MWTANLEDGKSISSKDCYWTQLPRGKKLTGVQLTHPQWLQHPPRLHLCLREMDAYFFIRHAKAMMGSQSAIEAETVGGVDEALGTVTEIRLDYTGTAAVSTYPLTDLPYDRSILHPGVGKRGAAMRPESRIPPVAISAVGV